jgi:hypothetical protein
MQDWQNNLKTAVRMTSMVVIENNIAVAPDCQRWPLMD